MRIKNKREAIAGIKKDTVFVKGKKYTRFIAYIGTDANGKRIRILGNTPRIVQDRIAEWYDTSAHSPALGHSLSPVRLADAVMATAKLEESGLTISMFQIVTEYISKHAFTAQSKPMTEAYDEYMTKFNDAQVAQIDYVRRTVGKFVALHPTQMVCSITANDVKSYLDSLQPCAVKTYNNALGYIKTFFNWCAKKARGWCEKDFLEGLEPKTEENKPIEAASVDAIRELFRTIYTSDAPQRDFLMYRLALSCFGGMRAEEITRLDPDDIRMEDESILVRDPKGSQSGSRISYRTFEINDTLRQWLSAVDMDKVQPYLSMSSGNFCRLTQNIRKKIKGHSYPPNFGRHSFISYHVAKYNDPNRTAGICGNSVAMIRTHYQRLYTKAEGEAYFGITPGSVSAPVSAA